MKKILFIALIFTSLHSSAQQPDSKELLREGIALNDAGDYENAIKKYDQLLAADANNFDAQYEKANTLTYLKKFDDCIDLCKILIKNYPDNPGLNLVYVVYGSAVDYTGKSKDAIKIYDEGLKKFAGYYLLLYNKGLTLQSIEKYEDAYENYQLALKSNPFHASSYLRIASLLKGYNKIPALMSCMMQLLCEPEGDRAAVAFKNVKELTYGNITKNDKGNNVITVSLPDLKRKKQPDDFSSVEMMFSLMAASSGDTAVNKIATTEIDKFDFTLQMLITDFSIDAKKQKGFFWERYAPFFVELKEKGYTNIASRLIYKTSGDDANVAWLQTHTDKVNEFYKWMGAYKWPQ